VHSPPGAGNEHGLQDAYNLGWKLALVVKGHADSSLLDTYEQERLPVAQRLLRTTDRAFQIIVADGWFGTVFRTRVMARLAAFAMTQDRVRKLAFRTVSQIGIRYPQSTLSVTLPGLSEGAPVAGDRFPWVQLKLRANGAIEDLFQKLDDTRFNLLVFGQPAPSEESLGSGEMLCIHEIAEDPANAQALARVHISGPAFYLLRPDGHIGFAGGHIDVEAVRRYLSDRHLRIGQAPIGRHEARTRSDQTTLT
jgi:hypothetical protein